MNIEFTDIHKGDEKNFAFYFYNYEVWDVEYKWDDNLNEELEKELKRKDVWLNPRKKLRSNYNGSSLVVDKICNDLIAQKNEILEYFDSYKPDYFKNQWVRGLDHYKKTSKMLVGIFWDQPGFQITPHLDNRHLIIQGIINLTNNESSTQYHSILSWDTVYTAKKERHTGSMFVNGPGMVHSIKNPNKDRYILYASIIDF